MYEYTYKWNLICIYTKTIFTKWNWMRTGQRKHSLYLVLYIFYGRRYCLAMNFFFFAVVVGAFALLLHKILRFSKPIYVQYIILLAFFPPVFSAYTISYTWSRVAFFSLASHRHLSVITINRSINIYLLDYLRSFIYMQRANIRPTKYHLTFKSCHLFFHPIFIFKKMY